MNASRKEMFEMEPPQMKIVFDRRHTKKNQTSMDLNSKKLKISFDWCA